VPRAPLTAQGSQTLAAAYSWVSPPRGSLGVPLALACRPQLVIADEPTSSLDTTVQADILALLAGLRERLQIAFLLITHNPAILAKFADRILVMHSGKIVEQGLATDVLGHPSHPYTKMLLKSRAQMVHSARAGS